MTMKRSQKAITSKMMKSEKKEMGKKREDRGGWDQSKTHPVIFFKKKRRHK